MFLSLRPHRYSRRAVDVLVVAHHIYVYYRTQSQKDIRKERRSLQEPRPTASYNVLVRCPCILLLHNSCTYVVLPTAKPQADKLPESIGARVCVCLRDALLVVHMCNLFGRHRKRTVRPAHLPATPFEDRIVLTLSQSQTSHRSGTSRAHTWDASWASRPKRITM